MTISTSARSERLETRVSKEMKEQFQKAAALEGRSLSEFIVSAASEMAALVIKKHEEIALSDRDRELLFEAIRNPPEPNAALRKAYNRRKELIES